MNLTREQIKQMPAGREMDALIAQHIFGWDMQGDFEKDGKIMFVDMDSNFSTRIQNAWEVVEKLRAFGWTVHFSCYPAPRFTVQMYQQDDDACCINHTGIVEAETAPLAICRAALLCKL